jgi:hypothetical protein
VLWAIKNNGQELFWKSRRLKSLLPLLRPTACADPRDKVLALLGVGHDNNKYIVFPDYRWPVANLYVAIVKYWLESERTPDLSFLSHVQLSNPEHKLPSWVPDWSCPAIAAPILDLDLTHASGDSEASVKLGEMDLFAPLKTSHELRIRGFVGSYGTRNIV